MPRSDSRRKLTWAQLLVLSVSVLVGVIVVVPVAVLFFLFVYPPLVLHHMFRERRLRRRLKPAGRLTTFDAIQPVLTAGHGKLLVETFHNGHGNVWWVNTDTDFPLPPALHVYGEDHDRSRAAVELLHADATRNWCLQELPALAPHAALVTDGRKRWRTLPEHLVLAVFWTEARAFHR